MKSIELQESPVPMRDIQNGLRLYFKKIRLGSIFVGVLTVLLAISFLYLWLLTGKEFLGSLFSYFFAFGFFSLLYAFIYLPNFPPRSYFKRIAALGKLTTVIDDSGILEKAENAQAFHNWDAVVKHAEDEEGIIIYFVGGNFKYIPKRLLGAEEEMELKEKLALSRLKK